MDGSRQVADHRLRGILGVTEQMEGVALWDRRGEDLDQLGREFCPLAVLALWAELLGPVQAEENRDEDMRLLLDTLDECESNREGMFRIASLPAGLRERSALA